MALIIAVYEDNRPIDGIETGWDEVERALDKTAEPFPTLRAIDPYELRVLSREELRDLVAECDHLLPQTSERAARTIARLKELATTVLASEGSVLRLIGD